jgi:hypothetical protein
MALPPASSWTAAYQHGRRKARHRCRCCSRILNAGESVIMARVAHDQTIAIHALCGDVRHGTADWTWREAMAMWGTEHLRAVGWKIPLAASGGV